LRLRKAGQSATARTYPMTDSEEIKRSLDIIRKRAGSLKDDLLNFLLDMTILHLRHLQN